MAYQISNYNYNHSMGSPPNMEAGFLDAFGVIMHGAVVPLIVRPMARCKTTSHSNSTTPVGNISHHCNRPSGIIN